MIPDKLTSEQLDKLFEARAEPSYKTTGVLDSSIIMLLDSVDRKYLTQLITEHYYEPGDVLIREGDEGDVAYMIWSGHWTAEDFLVVTDILGPVVGVGVSIAVAVSLYRQIFRPR